MEIIDIYGNQCGSDNAFTRKARLLPMYRAKRKEYGQQEPPSVNTWEHDQWG